MATTIPQNKAVLGFAKQSAKGTAASASTHRLWLSGGSMVHAVVTKEDYLETNGYQTPLEAYNSMVEGKGAPEFFAMPSALAALLLGILGTDTPSGSGDPYSHVITESPSIPYWTVWSSTGGALYEKFVDCKLAHLKIHGESGKALRVTATFMAGAPSFLASEETTATLEKSGRFLYYDGLAALKIRGSAVPLMKSFDLDIDRGTAVIAGDSLTPADAVVGPLAITLGVTATPADFADYNRVVYGSASPSDADPVTQTPDTLAGSPAGIDFKFTRSTDRTLELAIPNVQTEPFQDSVSATPGALERTNTWKAYKPSAGTTIMTATVKNADATIT